MPDHIDPHTRNVLLEHCGATAIGHIEHVQTLWSGYGAILRVQLEGSRHASVIIKQVAPPDVLSHPRGWANDQGDARKRRSYAVEAHWYRHHARNCPDACRVAEHLHVEGGDNDHWLLVLEDLSPAFPSLKSTATLAESRRCLHWLASFHAHGLGSKAEGLWSTGCYWHLQTRPDELANMPDSDIKRAAHALDACLSGAKFQTLVHGDAKLANFCFATQSDAVAAVDFQYVGRGPGIRDLAYFLGSALDDDELETHTDELVDHYFSALRGYLSADVDGEALEQEWRSLLPVAWTDFTRFLLGWAPSHRKLNAFSTSMAKDALQMLSY